MASCCDLDDITNLTHVTEEVLSAIREDKLTFLPPVVATIVDLNDLLRKLLDAVKVAVDESREVMRFEKWLRSSSVLRDRWSSVSHVDGIRGHRGTEESTNEEGESGDESTAAPAELLMSQLFLLSATRKTLSSWWNFSTRALTRLIAAKRSSTSLPTATTTQSFSVSCSESFTPQGCSQLLRTG